MCCRRKLQGQLGTHGQMPESLGSWLSPLLHFQSVGLQAVAAARGQVRGDRLTGHPALHSHLVKSRRRRLPTNFLSFNQEDLFSFYPSRISLSF